ncbi:hypothetical protein HK105_208882 [Polyrhizophydium stewartii]|uniref:ER membrane protein complex subunit 1 n=1 Tax=Polyrhizophydium stewartii TaxID=2732419 RepID=A0ABR4MWR4_9FUNG
MLSIAKRALAALALARGAAALYREDAGAYDWHTPLVGTPSQARFDAAGRLFVATNRNAVASLEPTTGDIVWRQVLEAADELHGVFTDSADAVVSLSGRAAIRAWNRQTGAAIWETDAAPLLPPAPAGAADCTTPSVLRAAAGVIALLPTCDIVALSANGKVKWTLPRNDQESLTRMALTGNSLHVVTWSPASANIVSRKVDVADGSVGTLAEHKPTDIESPSQIILAEADDAPHAIVVSSSHMWGVNLEKSFSFEVDVSPYFGPQFTLHAIKSDGLNPEFVIVTPAFLQILRIVEGDPTVVHSIEYNGASAVKLLATAASRDSRVVAAVSGSNSKYTLSLWTTEQVAQTHSFELDESEFGGIAFISGSPIEGMFQLTVVTQDGSVHLINEDVIVWTREESLSQVADAAFLDLPQSIVYSQQFDELQEEPRVSASISPVERYIRRWSVHLSKLMSLFGTLGGAESSQPEQSANGTADLSDAHGFRKLLVLVSTTGKVNALDTLTGQTVWSRYLPGIFFDSLHIVRTSRVKYPAIVVFVGHSSEGTVIWRLNGLNGNDFVSEKQPGIAAETLIRGGDRIASLIGAEEEDEHTQILALVDEHDEVSLFPNTPAAHVAFEAKRLTSHIFRTDGADGLVGFAINPRSVGLTTYSVSKTWELRFPAGEKLVSVSERDSSAESVASIGRVLGDRRVLYKYLNPNLLGLATVRKEDQGTITTFFYIIDTVSGAIHYRNAHHGAGPTTDAADTIHVLQCENWFVYSVWNHGPDAVSDEAWHGVSEATIADLPGNLKKKGLTKKKLKAAATSKPSSGRPGVPDAKQLEVVAIEIYESAKPDARIASTSLSSFSASRPGIVAQAYVFPLPVTAIGVTKTQASITSREVLIGIKTGMLYGLNKRFLDPRRPDRLTAEDKEAGMIPYSPNLGFATREVASYSLNRLTKLFLCAAINQVLGIERIISAPTNLESTSLVASYGLDLFCSRRVPSQSFDVLSPDFNYLGLIATLVGLVVGILVAKHFADRKRLADQWR